jgi:hypothetical protein
VYEETSAEEDGKDGGTFCLFVTPPMQAAHEHYHRNIVFLLDRSGSMTGDPYLEATRALEGGLRTLGPGDMFTIVVFDHAHKAFSDALLPATPDHIREAIDWMVLIRPDRGGTDIKAPVEWALQLLETHESDDSVLPFCVLLTDGCVANEREICTSAQSSVRRTRILTFGIGPFANWFFLKMLATIGRGFTDTTVFGEKIYAQMTALLNSASHPLITNISLDLPQDQNIELYPSPLPDLFLGSPLQISGSFTGSMPTSLTLRGVDGTGQPVCLTVEARKTEIIPVGKVLIKQRLDLLTSQAWLHPDRKQLENEVVELSCASSMPSAYTTMMAYEPVRSSRPDDEHKDEGDKKKSKLPLYRDKKALAALGVGGGVMLGAALFAFGDIGATADNVGMLGDVADAGGCCDGDGCCGDDGECCDCECGDCCDGGCDCTCTIM